MKKSKPNFYYSGVRGLDRALKTVIIIAITFSFILFIGYYLTKRIMNSRYFLVEEIIFGEKNPSDGSVLFILNAEKNARLDLSYLKGQNIFAINLEKESEYIARHYPNYRKIRLIRVLPNRLYLNFMTRKPLALVKLRKYFCIDEDKVLFDPPEELDGAGLPVITGLEAKIVDARAGRKYNNRELTLALNIIRETKAYRALKDYKITRVDVATLSNASFFMLVSGIPGGYTKGKAEPKAKGTDVLEIKMGAEDTKNRIRILAELLNQMKNEPAGIKYIDLRFKEPVIRFKDAKLK